MDRVEDMQWVTISRQTVLMQRNSQWIWFVMRRILLFVRWLTGALTLSLITKSLPKTSFGHAGGTFFLCCVFFSFFSNLNSSRNFNAASVLLSHSGNHGNSERINIMQKPEKLCGPFFRFSSYPWLNAMKNILISIWQSTFTHNFTYATVFGWCRFFSRSRLFVRVFLSLALSLFCFVVDWLLVTGNEAQILLY